MIPCPETEDSMLTALARIVSVLLDWLRPRIWRG
jgi:hypothetical protein